jgi:hypothetical protein
MIKNKSVELLKIGLLIMFLSLVFLSTKFSFDSNFNKNDRTSEPKTTNNTQAESSSGNESRWSKYVNEEYSISFLYPTYLTKVKLKDSGEYDFFIRFEENKISAGKGVALGIRKGLLEDEVLGIKENLSNEGRAILVKEENINTAWGKGKILEFKPENEEGFESRSFIIIEKDGNVYSLSTVPEQVQILLNSIEFKI